MPWLRRSSSWISGSGSLRPKRSLTSTSDMAGTGSSRCCAIMPTMSSATSTLAPCPAPRNFTTNRPPRSVSTTAGRDPPSRSGCTYRVATCRSSRRDDEGEGITRAGSGCRLAMSPSRNVSRVEQRGKRARERSPEVVGRDAVAVARRCGHNEELGVRVALVDRLMRDARRDLDPRPCHESVARAVDLHGEHTGQHVEELPCRGVAMTRFAGAGWHALLDHAESIGSDEVPAVAAVTPAVVVGARTSGWKRGHLLWG